MKKNEQDPRALWGQRQEYKQAYNGHPRGRRKKEKNYSKKQWLNTYHI